MQSAVKGFSATKKPYAAIRAAQGLSFIERSREGRLGWGAWIRTKIHSFKGCCAAIAPRPSNGPNCITGAQAGQLFFFVFAAGSQPKAGSLLIGQLIRFGVGGAFFNNIVPEGIGVGVFFANLVENFHKFER